MAARIVVEDSTGELFATGGAATFGGRTGADVVLDDPGVADRHCSFDHDAGFRVRDLGSVTGTWLDGQPVGSFTEIQDGAQVVIGMSRITAKVEQRDGVSTLVLQLQRNAFWWRKSGKKVFDNDPDAMVRAEVGFGRWPALRAANRAAIVLALVLLLGGTFVASLLEPLADAGPLLPTHAVVTGGEPVASPSERFTKCRALAEEQGCNVCHTTGAGTPEAKCLQCHGDLQQPATARHPYLGDGVLQALPGMGDTEDFCVVCHRDHQGSEFLKPAAKALLGDCRACHGPLDDRALDELKTRVRPAAPPPRMREIELWRFPHDAHVGGVDGKAPIDCVICHVADARVQADRERGLPDDPRRDDFAEVPFATCASCHVRDAPLSGMTAEQRDQWRASEKNRWTVAWHGSTHDGGAKCLQCHRQEDRGGATVFGPGFATVSRPDLTPAQHAAERARYTSPVRKHTAEFAAHANGRQCTECHLAGAIASDAAPKPRTFWHALHLSSDAVRPAAGKGGETSNDLGKGCLSCHQDMLGAKGLRDANTAAYHWPAEQDACVACHFEGTRDDGKPRPPPLQAFDTAIAPERRTSGDGDRIQFPHDVHVTSAAFGRTGKLAEGCFACHDFVQPEGGSEFQLVPRTKETAATCAECHTAHANIGGGQCDKCHPVDDRVGNSFLVSAKVAPGTPLRRRSAPPPLQRSDWPGENPFSHVSPGHAELACAECHVDTGRSSSLADVPIPDETAKACRDCHLQRQFHWR